MTNHALVDGNNRLGWLGTAVFLEINGVVVSRADNDDVYDLVIDVAAGRPTVEEIAEQLESLPHGTSGESRPSTRPARTSA